MQEATVPPPSPLLIPELLEAILLYTQPFTVITACRAVCRSWRTLVDTSPLLRRHTWRAEDNVPVHRRRLKAVGITFKRNPMLSNILTAFWRRLNAHTTTSGDGEPAPATANELVAAFTPICQAMRLADPAPADVTFRFATQRQIGHMLARTYRTWSSPDEWQRQLIDLMVLTRLMRMLVRLRDEKEYQPGARNSLVVEAGYDILLRKEGEVKRRQVYVEERLNFQCCEPWNVSILEVDNEHVEGGWSL
ncbi:hypothetical protein Dda_6345 [Drechslerella dactyloides]|uniref:F-box domain-containing protein n=1 Tax=Drechslerella dactyloides TaxID=74499 RepID=A0AAD6ITE0_DREDA|nr:hypothetical protein Dda_6345 [Drechslerella dactyloides]